jgi:hypothetical protein
MNFLAFQLNNDASLFWILVIIAICFAVMAFSMIFIAFMVYRAVGMVGELKEKTEPLIQSANNISAQGKEIAAQFTTLSEHLTVSAKYLSESAGLIKEEVGEIKVLIGQTTETAKEKVALVSRTIDRTNVQVQDTADFIQHKVVEPAREFAAIMAGVRRGLEVLLAPTPRQLDRAYTDDEMFIG